MDSVRSEGIYNFGQRKKILLVTLQSTNIGNRLQNYALQEILREFNCDVYTPYYFAPEEDTLKKRIKNRIRIILGILKVTHYRESYLIFLRKKKFKKFDDLYIQSHFKISFDALYMRDWSMYNYAIVGSDQVWHKWSGNEKELDFFYLRFFPGEKCIAYAPSFGFEEFPPADKEQHIEGIRHIGSISARELAGKHLIESVRKEDIPVVLDPTLLLTKEKWLKLSKMPKKYINSEYILVYFLGEKRKYWDNIVSFAEQNRWKIINICDKENELFFDIDPNEFLWLISNSKYVLTDSFHACVFSILFHVDFTSFKRQQNGFTNMYDRIENLLEQFKLKGNTFSGENIQIHNVNWTECDEILKDRREESISYLREVLCGINEYKE